MKKIIERLLTEGKMTAAIAYLFIAKTGTQEQYIEIIQSLLDRQTITADEAYVLLDAIKPTQEVTIQPISVPDPCSPGFPNTPWSPWTTPNTPTYPWTTPATPYQPIIWCTTCSANGENNSNFTKK